MYGAILGDIIGSPYEFGRGDKTKVFPLFSEESEFTDDTILTVAVADALLQSKGLKDTEIYLSLIENIKKWCEKYDRRDYGSSFYEWCKSSKPVPYNSWGNGSAMRVSSVGWLYDTLEETRRIAVITAKITHNHPEGVKGAESVASAIFLARNHYDKDYIKNYIVKEFDYNLNRTLDDIRPYYCHVENCMETVPEAIISFLEGNDFEDTVRNAVSLGGDCDTLGAIAGSIAEAYFGIPDDLILECKNRIPSEMLEIVERI